MAVARVPIQKDRRDAGPTSHQINPFWAASRYVSGGTGVPPVRKSAYPIQPKFREENHGHLVSRAEHLRSKGVRFDVQNS
jgi:hypothetical protein